MANPVLISIIGSPLPTCFSLVLQALERIPVNWPRLNYPTISDAIDAGVGQQFGAEFTLVLQSSPEQFAQRDIELLLGKTIMSSLVCCYGPWCESSGRSTSHWPQSVRIPARMAASAIVVQLQKLAQGQPTLSSLAASEEAFSFRTIPGPPLATVYSRRSGNRPLAAVVVSHDTALRRTVAQLCQSFGMAAVEYHDLDGNLSAISSRLAVPPEIVIVDLDDFQGDDKPSEPNIVLKRFPTACRVGLTWIPGTDFRPVDGGLWHQIVAKMDLQNGLMQAIQQFSS